MSDINMKVQVGGLW